MAKVKSITVSIERTLQIVQYNPSTVRVEEVIELKDDDDIKDVKAKAVVRISNFVSKVLDHEVEKYHPDGENYKLSKIDKANKKGK